MNDQPLRAAGLDPAVTDRRVKPGGSLARRLLPLLVLLLPACQQQMAEQVLHLEPHLAVEEAREDERDIVGLGLDRAAGGHPADVQGHERVAEGVYDD